MDFTKVSQALAAKGVAVSEFSTAAEAADYLNRCIDGKSVGFGGSITLGDMGLYESLGAHNQVFWHWRADPAARGETLRAAANAEIYLLSANAVAETGEIVNIDGTGNRVAAAMYGHKKVYFVVGANKLTPTLEEAVHRARNVAAPQNARRLGLKTPCAAKADRCYDCASPDRICCGLSVLWHKMLGCEMEVVFLHEALGY